MSVEIRRESIVRAAPQWLYPTLAILLSLFAIAPLAYPGFWQSYTGYSAIYNLMDLHAELGSVWSWAPASGREYDFFRADGPLGYWVAEATHLGGLSFVSAVKLVYALAFVSAAYGMFRLARQVLRNDAAGLLAAALYVYFPSHIAAVYVRGAFGEAVLWGLAPWALWAVVVLCEREKFSARAFSAGVAAFALCVLAQPGLAVWLCIVAAVWIALVGAKQGRKFAWGAIGAGLLVGVVLLLPALLPQTGLSAANAFVPAFVYPFELLTATWGTAPPRGVFEPVAVDATTNLAEVTAANVASQAPAQIGFAVLVLTVMAGAMGWRMAEDRRKTKDEGRRTSDERWAMSDEERGQRIEGMKVRRVFWVSVGISAVALVMMLPWVEGLWNSVGLTALVQYPFQLLFIVGLMLSLAAATLVVSDARWQEIPLLGGLTLIPLLAVFPYLAPTYTDLTPAQPALARFNNDEIALLDARVLRPPGVWRHGATVELDLTWQALKQPNRDYTVFLKVVDKNGNEWGATDEKPQDGKLSTLQWTPGQVIEDTHSVQIQLEGPPEGYHIELGLYPATTGERAVTDGGGTSVRVDDD